MSSAAFHLPAVLVVATLGLGACATTRSSSTAATDQHGRLTELSRVQGPIVLCEHKVPESVCTRHHPELVAQFKRAGDWCAPHGVPESQCLECHPDLTFDPLPKLPADADVVWLSRQGEDVPDLDTHAVKGKVTVFDFYADWCAACRKVDGHVFKRLASNDRTLAYRKINIVSWETPVAQRYMQEVPSLPLLVVYARDGKRFKSMHGADLDALEKAISEAATR
jgi:thiol-disulfide isomerase/thioredoxin